MAFNLSNIKNLPAYVKIIIAVTPSLLVVILFLVIIYFPKNNEIKDLQNIIVKLENDISNAEVKVRKLDELKVRNKQLKEKLAELKQQLPEEEEISGLLKQISDLGINSGLEVLLWRPQEKKPDPDGLFIEIPVRVEVRGNYHNLGNFFSRVSQLKRIVNLSNIELDYNKPTKKIMIRFNAATFSAVTK